MINVVLTSENESALRYFQLWIFVSKILSHTNVPAVISESCFRKYFLLKIFIRSTLSLKEFIIDNSNSLSENMLLLSLALVSPCTGCLTVSLLKLAVGCCALPRHGENMERQTTLPTHVHTNSSVPQMHAFGLWTFLWGGITNHCTPTTGPWNFRKLFSRTFGSYTSIHCINIRQMHGITPSLKLLSIHGIMKTCITLQWLCWGGLFNNPP